MRRPAAVLVTLSLAALGGVGPMPRARAQGTIAPATSVDTTLQAGEAEAVPPRRQFTKWNEFDGPVSTLRYGFNLMYDFSAYHQDAESREQFPLSSANGLRDFRLVFGGQFKTKRPLSWSLGYMYDGADKEWRFRQTGISVGLPEISGKVFVGRTKEGYSMIKVMTGAYIWGVERNQALDAFVPILADGIKYMGYWERQRFFVNLGYYGDAISEAEKFSTYDNQLVTRIGWQPILSTEENRVLHVAVMARNSKPDGNSLREKSRPGDYLAPFFLDSGKFAADHSRTMGLEAWYRNGPWLFGTEYDWQKDDALTGERPLFQGGNVTAVWSITGETRPYNAPGGFFEELSANKTVFEGGPGAWETGLDLTYNDFDSGTFRGGKFWRLTPMLIWHPADFLRVTTVYGYAVLDRFDLKGTTQFFQTRLQAVY